MGSVGIPQILLSRVHKHHCLNTHPAVADAPRLAVAELRHALELGEGHKLSVLQTDGSLAAATCDAARKDDRRLRIPVSYLELEPVILHARHQCGDTWGDARHYPRERLLACIAKGAALVR